MTIRGRWFPFVSFGGSCAIVAGVLAACTGPTGPAGEAGPAGSAGFQGSPGPAGPDGVPGESASSTLPDGGIPVGCLSPCHGFNGVVSQFQSSVHYAAYVSNIDTSTAEEWTATGSACGNCHAIDALAGRVTGNVGTQAGGAVTNVTNGELEYRTTTGTTTDSTYTGTASVAEVYCTTCHAVTDANDPHRTGAVWTPGSFPLMVSEAAGAISSIEKSPSTSSVTGTSIGALGPANTCVWCHKSRKDVTSYITGPAKLSGFWGPHEGPQADLFSAKGGYEFTGMTYGTSTHQEKLTCIDCHMPSVANNAGVPDHSFNARLTACQSCHIGATSFDVNGGQSLISAGMFELQAALNTAGYLTRATAAPYTSLAGTQLTDGAFDTDQPFTGVTTVSADAAGALYNYILIARGGALGVHNPKYEQQLLFDSYFALTGNPPTSIVRPN